MEYAFRRTLTRFLLLLGVLGLFTGMVWAQAGTGELTGLVADPSGAVIPNAQVTLINNETGEKRTTTTTQAGVYRFSALPVVGSYTLDVAPKGFKSARVSNIVISVGSTATQDVKLEIGQTSEQVTVEAGVETVQTTESDLSQLVDRRIWQQMPLQIRNQNSFIELVPGAVPQDGTNSNRGAEVNGTRGGAGSYLVDGTDNNEQGQAGRGQISFYDKGGAATSISPDAIQEYRVITNSYSAEYGKGGGFITDTVLKSGTNQYHGSAFEYNRIQALTANDWFSNNAGIQDHLVRNQFGGSFGGPIIKDKTFFYGTGELHRVRQSYPTTITATTQQFVNFAQSGGLQNWAESDPNGICMQVTGSPCPGAFALSSTTGPIFNQLISNPAMHFPLANDTRTCPTSFDPNVNSPCYARSLWPGQIAPGLTAAGNPLVYPVPVYDTLTLTDPTSQDEARFSVKIDHRFSDKDTLSGVYLFQDATYTDQFLGGNNLVGPQYIQDGRGQNLGITWTHTFTPTVLNTFKISYLRHRLDFPPPKGTFGTPGYYTLDGLGEDLGLSIGSPQFFTDNQFQYLDTMSVVKGKHSFKFGGEYRRTRNGSRFFLDNFQFALPWGIEDVVTDLAFSDEAETLLTGGHYYGGAYYLSASVNPTNSQAPDVYRGYRANEFAGFGQDDFRVSNRLTVNVGLRWEYFGVPHNFQPGIDSNVYFGSNVTPAPTATSNPFFPAGNPFYASVATATLQTRDHELWNKDTNNFSPRAGFAWDIFGNQKLVLRAGAGIMYDRIYNNTFENIRFNPPFFSDNQVGSAKNGVPVGAVSSPGLFSYPFTTRALYNAPGSVPIANPQHMDQNIITPYYEQFHVGFQYEFAKGWVFEPEYVGTLGRKLTGLSDINTFDGRTACAAPPYTSGPCFNAGFGTSGLPTNRINPIIGADNFRSNGYASNYHALQLSVRKNYAYGLSLSGNYTYSKSLDNVSDLFFNGATASGQGRPTDNMNHSYDYGPSDFDTRQRGVITVSYDLPFMKTNRWLGGWGTNAIVSLQSGHPWTPFSNAGNYDANKDGVRSDRVVPTTSIDGTRVGAEAPLGTLDPTKWVPYVCPASVNQGLWCNAPIGRNSVVGPDGKLVDFNVTKRFKITERAGLTFQANFFNLFNHPNFLNPTAGASGSANIRAADFSASRTTWSTGGADGGHRATQLALRFDF
ncbi:MAG TPA: TonB-dependent receptor [Terriglobales bacterium]